jgi:hypothetical protein
MSAEAYAQMSTDELIPEFVRLAQALRSAWTFWAKIPENTPERQAMDQELRAVAAELCARKPIEKIRPLFDHESVDVRFYAAMRFLPVDPDWAIAAISAHTADLSTKAVIALCARANERPPALPAVADMSTGQLVARFEDAGIRGYATRFLGGEFEPFDVELYNRIVRETRKIVDELNARGSLNALLPLLDHPNISVRRTAATYAISVAPDRTLRVLESISASRDSLEAPRASAALDRWNENKKKDAGELQT